MTSSNADTSPDRLTLLAPVHQGLRWGFISSCCTAAILLSVKRFTPFTLGQQQSAWMLGSMGVGVLGYSLGADMAKQHNRTVNLKRSYMQLEQQELLDDALPFHSERLRHHQTLGWAGLHQAAVLGVGSAALAAGVEAMFSPVPRPYLHVAREWGAIGAAQGLISGVLQASEHNKRAKIIQEYESKAGFYEKLTRNTTSSSEYSKSGL